MNNIDILVEDDASDVASPVVGVVDADESVQPVAEPVVEEEHIDVVTQETDGDGDVVVNAPQ